MTGCGASAQANGTEQRTKVCEACGREFPCCPGGCWCDGVKLAPETLSELRTRYGDCLCEECLRAHTMER